MPSTLNTALASFVRWWRRELIDIFLPLPSGGAQRYPRRWVFSIDNDGAVEVLEETNKSVRPVGPSRDGRTAGLIDIGVLAGELASSSRRPPPVGIRFSPAHYLKRTTDLPLAARQDVGRILQLELERETPFAPGEVYAADYATADANGTSGHFAAHQVILKRDHLDHAVEKLRSAGLQPKFADAWNAAQTAPLPIDFMMPREALESSRAARMRAVVYAAGLSALLFAASAWIMAQRYHDALATVDAQTRMVSEKVTAARAERSKSNERSDRIAFLAELKSERLPVEQILDRVTQLLPDSVWLTQFRIHDTQLEIGGYAGQTAPLIGEIERSQEFSDAKLASSTVRDPRTNKERFALQATLRGPALRPSTPANQK